MRTATGLASSRFSRIRAQMKVERAVLVSPSSPYGLCGRKANSTKLFRLRSCVKVERAVERPGLPVLNSPYGLCGREATLNLNWPFLNIGQSWIRARKFFSPRSTTVGRQRGRHNLLTSPTRHGSETVVVIAPVPETGQVALTVRGCCSFGFCSFRFLCLLGLCNVPLQPGGILRVQPFSCTHAH